VSDVDVLGNGGGDSTGVGEDITVTTKLTDGDIDGVIVEL